MAGLETEINIDNKSVFPDMPLMAEQFSLSAGSGCWIENKAKNNMDTAFGLDGNRPVDRETQNNCPEEGSPEMTEALLRLHESERAIDSLFEQRSAIKIYGPGSGP